MHRTVFDSERFNKPFFRNHLEPFLAPSNNGTEPPREPFFGLSRNILEEALQSLGLNNSTGL
jgi:hypothetical protein